MYLNPELREKLAESMASVLPITALVLALSVSVCPMEPGLLVLFAFGAAALVAGMGLFTLGVEMSMIPMGEGVGVQLSKSRHLWAVLSLCFVLGMVATLAEPDLQVLARQTPAIPSMVLIVAVAAGVGLFLLLAQLRILLHIPLRRLLLCLYALVFGLALLAPADFVPVSFDAGGVTTGPVTVPFLMAMGIGLASLRSDKGSDQDSFGLIALCSVGPVLAVLLLGIFYHPDGAVYSPAPIPSLQDTRQAAAAFLVRLPAYLQEVGVSLLPILALFAGFQLGFRRFHRRQLLRIGVGLLYVYVGLALFLAGVNVGFMPAGEYLGGRIAVGPHRWLLAPVGMVIGYFLVRAEPAVQVLNKQVEEVSNGSITQAAMQRALSLGVAASVGLAMLRILTGLPLLALLGPGYALSLGLSFFVPPIYTGIAFDSGGVASGPMTATFLLPFAMGACEALGGNVMADAFGVVAMVAMTPLVSIQLLGLASVLRERAARLRLAHARRRAEDIIVYFDGPDAA